MVKVTVTKQIEYSYDIEVSSGYLDNYNYSGDTSYLGSALDGADPAFGFDHTVLSMEVEDV